MKLAGARRVKQPAAKPFEFGAAVVRLGDEQQGKALVSEQAGLAFDLENPDFVRLERQFPELEARYKASKADLERLDKEVRATPQWVRVRKPAGDDEDAPIPFHKWELRHQVTALLCLSGFIATLAMSANTIAAILFASGQPIFIEQPWMVWAISMLGPCASIALEMVSGLFDSYAARKRYLGAMMVFTILALLCWAGLFALSFDNVASGIDWRDFGGGSGDMKGAALTLAQLLAEIFVGAVLFLSLNQIALDYSPALYKENRAYLNAVKSRDVHAKAHEKLADSFSEAEGQISKLRAMRQAHINEALVTYLAMRARMDAINNF